MELRNGPKGAWWAQKYIVRLDDNRTDVPRPCRRTSTRAHRSHQSSRGRFEGDEETNNQEFLPCPDQFKVKDSFLDKKKELTDGVFITTPEDKT